MKIPSWNDPPELADDLAQMTLYFWAMQGRSPYEQAQLCESLRSNITNGKFYSWGSATGTRGRGIYPIEYSILQYPDTCMCGRVFHNSSRRLRHWCYSCNGNHSHLWPQLYGQVPTPLIEIALSRGIYYEQLRKNRLRDT